MQTSKRNYLFRCTAPGNSCAYMFFLIEQDGSRVGKLAVRFDRDNLDDFEMILEIERREHASILQGESGSYSRDFGLKPTISIINPYVVTMEKPTIELIQDLRSVGTDYDTVEKLRARIE